MKVQVLSNDPVSRFAAGELESYLLRMGCPPLHYELSVGEVEGLERAADPALDDQFSIQVDARAQRIRGNNPRALLLGAYRYLTLIGCRFVRPGKAFEIIPVHSRAENFYAWEKKAAALRHRGVCIEGTDSAENIADVLDWLPKVGYNSFFFQFKTPFIFLSRWYGTPRPHHSLAEWTNENAEQLMQHFDGMMEERGLLRHRMGHGWTAEVIGASNATGWEAEEMELDDDIREIVAEVNGERKLHHGVAVNTNLCLSNPKARERFADCVVRYLQKTPGTEYLHIWLADGANNSCECESCRALRPADHYITLLNHLDARLTEAGISTRLCFLMYRDLLWAPLENRLNHPDRFVLMFAPIERTFESSFADLEALPPVPEFRLNQLIFPKDIASNAACLKAWRDATDCDAFIYDYPLARAHHGDPTHVGIARILWRDLQANRALGLNGISSCQELRNAYPNALGNYVMGRAAFDESLSFEDIALEYYQAAYGEGGRELLDLMERTAALFHQDYTNWNYCPTPRVNPALCENMRQVPALLDEIRALKTAQHPLHTGVEAYMWSELDFFLQQAKLLAEMILLRASDRREEALALLEGEYTALVRAHERTDQSSLDVDRNLNTYQTAFRAKPRPGRALE